MIGKHNWERVQDNKFHSLIDAKLGIQEQRARRTCIRCGKSQEMDVHCLGLNPPRYIKIWFDVKERGEYLKSNKARKIAEDNNKEFRRIMAHIKEFSNKGEICCILRDYDRGYDNSVTIRKLLSGMGYGMNKFGTGISFNGAKDLIIYW